MHLEWPPLVWLNCVCLCAQDWHLVCTEFCCMSRIPVFSPGLTVAPRGVSACLSLLKLMHRGTAREEGMCLYPGVLCSFTK